MMRLSANREKMGTGRDFVLIVIDWMYIIKVYSAFSFSSVSSVLIVEKHAGKGLALELRILCTFHRYTSVNVQTF